MLHIVDVYRASQFLFAINPLPLSQALYARERWASAGYRTKLRSVPAPTVAPRYTVPFHDLEGYVPVSNGK